MPAIKPKFEYGIICDDIRQEIGNKHSFIGIYGSDIFVSKIPFVFPKLCFAISYKNVKAGNSFSIELSDPSGKQLGETIKGVTPQRIKGRLRFLMFAILTPLKVEIEGSHKLSIIFNEDEKSKQEVGFNIKLIEKTE